MTQELAHRWKELGGKERAVWEEKARSQARSSQEQAALLLPGEAGISGDAPGNRLATCPELVKVHFPADFVDKLRAVFAEGDEDGVESLAFLMGEEQGGHPVVREIVVVDHIRRAAAVEITKTGAEQLSAHADVRAGMRVLGWCHSHPTALQAIASVADLKSPVPPGQHMLEGDLVA